MAAQLFVFMMAMSYRYQRSLVERQETQEKLIAQLQENKELQTKVNRELEQKVRERTVEIEQQKEEIETQHEALQTKSEELGKAYKNITDSARYAQRLQGAILGEEKEVLSFFRGWIYFVFAQRHGFGRFLLGFQNRTYQYPGCRRLYRAWHPWSLNDYAWQFYFKLCG